jgi:hypothetical protein
MSWQPAAIATGEALVGDAPMLSLRVGIPEGTIHVEKQTDHAVRVVLSLDRPAAPEILRRICAT